MILAVSILVGFFTGVLRAKANGTAFDLPYLRWYGLAIVGFIPQYVVFYSPLSHIVPNQVAGVALVFSQVLLLCFALINIRQPGFWILITGLLLNLTVILANGGFMPISPETVIGLWPEVSPDNIKIGARLGTGKDIVLPVPETRLPSLSDRYLLPGWSPYQVAFSLGDLFLMMGMIVFFWTIGGNQELEMELP